MDNAKKERALFLLIIILAILLGVLIGMHYNKNPSINQSQNMNINLSPKDDCENKINLNTANEKVLASLPEIGEIKAKNIVMYRNRNGNFSNINDLLNVKGIGENIISAIKDKVVVK